MGQGEMQLGTLFFVKNNVPNCILFLDSNIKGKFLIVKKDWI